MVLGMRGFIVNFPPKDFRALWGIRIPQYPRQYQKLLRKVLGGFVFVRFRILFSSVQNTS